MHLGERGGGGGEGFEMRTSGNMCAASIRCEAFTASIYCSQWGTVPVLAVNSLKAMGCGSFQQAV